MAVIIPTAAEIATFVEKAGISVKLYTNSFKEMTIYIPINPNIKYPIKYANFW
jgi:hypothetical protein